MIKHWLSTGLNTWKWIEVKFSPGNHFHSALVLLLMPLRNLNLKHIARAGGLPLAQWLWGQDWPYIYPKFQLYVHSIVQCDDIPPIFAVKLFVLYYNVNLLPNLLFNISSLFFWEISLCASNNGIILAEIYRKKLVTPWPMSVSQARNFAGRRPHILGIHERSFSQIRVE